MTTRFGRVVLAVAGTTALAGVNAAEAQPLGIFRWQTQPYCNVLALTVVQQGPSFTLHGTDDLCGAAQLAPVAGTAALNPDGSISLGFVVVTPAGPAAHLNAVVSLATVSGTWHDADGNTGGFLFNGPGGGAARPAPRTAAVITSVQLAASIFAGTGAATTLARSDHTHDDRYLPQVVVGPGNFVPATLAPQYVYHDLVETITTTRAGRLLISKSARLNLGCTAARALFYLLVDGVPVRSGVVMGDPALEWNGQITGVTPDTIPAGTHTIGFGAECQIRSTSTGGGGWAAISSSSVVVIP